MILTPVQLADFARDGYLIMRGLFSTAEAASVLSSAQRERDNAMTMNDASGRPARLSLWSAERSDLLGVLGRSARIARPAEQLLGGEIYLWHGKVMQKEPGGGGGWEWHQDYGYWYHDGCLSADLLSCMLALESADLANGCLELLRGSHLLGRQEHGTFGGQSGCDPERVAAAEQRCARVRFEAAPGDAVFFHANTLHSSGPNLSTRSRWAFISAYNMRQNSPLKSGFHPQYTPLRVAEDAELLGAMG